MAGQPEIRIMTDFFNSKSKGLSVCKVRATPNKRVKDTFQILEGREWEVFSESRGKEAKVIFFRGTERHSLLVYFFKGGCWEWYKDESSVLENPNYERDHRFSIHFTDGSILSQQDQFHQSHWKWGNWGPYRSPDIVLEHNAFRRHMYEKRNHHYVNTPIYRVMMHPMFFNGINNFTRCEILARTRFSPFTTLKEILSSEILREDLFEVCKEVLEEVYLYGGMQFGIWKNPFGVDKSLLREWVQVYKSRRKNYFTVVDEEKILYVHKRWLSEFKLRGIQIREDESEEIDGSTDNGDI